MNLPNEECVKVNHLKQSIRSFENEFERREKTNKQTTKNNCICIE